MPGSYCKFCDSRCFVERIIPDPKPGSIAAAVGGRIHMATCPKGMEHDRKVSGYDHTTAINPSEATNA